MTAPTFFPPEVQRAIESVERMQECDVCPGREIATRLADELRRWEKAWRRGEARLVPQVEAKSNGEGGL